MLANRSSQAARSFLNSLIPTLPKQRIGSAMFLNLPCACVLPITVCN